MFGADSEDPNDSISTNCFRTSQADLVSSFSTPTKFSNSTRTSFRPPSNSTTISASLKNQLHMAISSRPIQFNILFLGHPSCGKDTFINSMIGQNIFTDADKIESHQKDPIPITKKLILNEDGVKLDVSLTKIPNIGWNCNNKHQISFCRKFVLSKLKNHLNFEFSAEGNYILKDRRFHLVLYFVSPNHRGLSELDLEILKGISLANKYVIVGKADSLLPNEFSSLKKIISAQLDENSIPTYNFRLGANIQCPAIIFSSMQMVENSINGETYGRPYEWGTACMSNSLYNDFSAVSSAIFSELTNLINITDTKYYEYFRKEKLSNIVKLINSDPIKDDKISHTQSIFSLVKFVEEIKILNDRPKLNDLNPNTV